MYTAGKGLIPVARGAWSYIRKWVRPPKIGYQLAPSNILEVVRPYANRKKIVELLGHPHHEWRERASYRFDDALMQVIYDESDMVDTVVLAALSLRWPHRFKVHPLNLKVGASTFYDACESDSVELRQDQSSKFTTFWIERDFGFPGNNHSFSFALVGAATYPPLDWGHRRSFPDWEGERWMMKDTRAVKFNAIAISRKEGELFPFSWEAFQ